MVLVLSKRMIASFGNSELCTLYINLDNFVLYVTVMDSHV